MDTAVDQLKELVKSYDINKKKIEGDYLEAQIRQEYIDRFFKLLNWDVTNEKGNAPQYRDVIIEDRIRKKSTTEFPDYCFQFGGDKLFYVEAKRPSETITNNTYVYQLKRYAWSSKLPLAILTNFRELAIYRVQKRPNKRQGPVVDRVKYIPYEKYVEEWDYIKNIFSKEAVRKGEFHDFVENYKKERGDETVDEAFLNDIEKWRFDIARNIIQNNTKLGLDSSQLTYSVQRIIDRLLFLRVCEDRGIEKFGNLKNLLDKQNISQSFYDYCEDADATYNSGLFHFKSQKGRNDDSLDKLTHTLTIEDKIFKRIINSLYYPDSPYAFNVLSSDFFGTVYEQFLGKTISIKSKTVKIEEKPELKKRQGVFYTPEYIVRYMIEKTVRSFCEGKTPEDVSKLRIVDIACGSGAFLIQAYTTLLNWHLEYYRSNQEKSHLNSRKIYKGQEEETFLSIKEKRKILLNNIYGVDKDFVAVEVAKLGLLLKLLEGEEKSTFEEQQMFIPKHILPDLSENIKCGNSLIDMQFSQEDPSRNSILSFNWNEQYSTIMNKEGGFDIVIGNPPYVRQESLKELKSLKDYFESTYETYQSTVDLYVYFIERGYKLLKQNGQLCYIVSNKWMRTDYGQNLRSWLKSKKILEIVDFGTLPVFKGTNTWPCIIQVEKSVQETKYFKACRIRKQSDLSFGAILEKVKVDSIKVNQNKLNDRYWALITEREQDLLTSMLNISKKQSVVTDAEDVKRGILTGRAKVFIITKRDGDRIIHHYPESQSMLKPVISGREISRYAFRTPDNYMIVIPKGWTKKQVGEEVEEEEALNWCLKNYPGIFEYLCKHEKEVEGREDQGDYWWELRGCKYYHLFEQEKIIFQDIAGRGKFALGTAGLYLDNSAYVVDSNSKFLLGLLNSKLYSFIMANISSELSNGTYRWIKQHFLDLPLPSSTVEQKAKIEQLVLQMLSLANNLVKTISRDKKELKKISDSLKQYDSQIDSLVYDLFNLNSSQQKLIDDFCKENVNE